MSVCNVLQPQIHPFEEEPERTFVISSSEKGGKALVLRAEEASIAQVESEHFSTICPWNNTTISRPG